VHRRDSWPGVAPYQPAWHGSGIEVPAAHAYPRGQIPQPSADCKLLELENVPERHGIAIGVPRGHCKCNRSHVREQYGSRYAVWWVCGGCVVGVWWVCGGCVVNHVQKQQASSAGRLRRQALQADSAGRLCRQVLQAAPARRLCKQGKPAYVSRVWTPPAGTAHVMSRGAIVGYDCHRRTQTTRRAAAHEPTMRCERRGYRDGPCAKEVAQSRLTKAASIPGLTAPPGMSPRQRQLRKRRADPDRQTQISCRTCGPAVR
jgi:hypothetical protein